MSIITSHSVHPFHPQPCNDIDIEIIAYWLTEATMQDINRLWAHANSPGGGLLASYPSLLADMLEEAAVHKSGDLPHLLLPSDSKWQSKMYKQLVEQQRKLNMSVNYLITELHVLF